MILPVIGERFVELAIIFLCDVVWVTGPQGLCFVEFFIFLVLLLNLLFLLLVFLVIFVIFFFFLLCFLLIIRHFLVPLFLTDKFDWVANELTVFLHYIFDALLFK